MDMLHCVRSSVTAYFLIRFSIHAKVSLVTFGTYVLVDEKNVLDSEKVFVSLTLFNILQFPLTMLPFMINELVQVNFSSFLKYYFIILD